MKIYNFAAGPAMLPEVVMRKAQAEFLDYQGSGSGILELSHRGKFFQPVIDRAEANVREILGVEPKHTPLFFKPTGPDKLEAAKRLAITEQCFEGWYNAINGTNTRQVPSDLVELYEEATVVLCRILQYEKNIVTGGM